MKIAHVIDSMDLGGAEKLVLCLAQAHGRLGHDISVHCLLAGGALAQKLTEQGVPVTVHGPLSGWRTARALYRTFRQCRPDLVHCHNALASMAGAPAARLAGAGGVVCTRHGLIPTPRRVRHARFWLAARFADRVVAVCQQAALNLAAAPFAIRRKLTTILNGAPPAPCGSATDADSIHKDGLTAITVGRLAPPKDHATLLRAVAAAANSVPDLRLWIVGDGVDAGELRELTRQLGIEHRVRFLGERHDVGNWLAKADFFVLSSRSEGVPVSLLEAMAAGLPVIVSDVGGMPEIVELSRAGTLVPAGQPEPIAIAIQNYAGDRDRMRHLGQLARKCYLENFTAERMAQDYFNLYRACLAAREQKSLRDGQTTVARRRRFILIYEKLRNAITPGLRSSQYEYRDTLKEHLNGHCRWLDLGCGRNLFGTWMQKDEIELLQRHNNIVGIDCNYFNLKQHPNIRNKVAADGGSVPFKDASFDLISANMVVEHLEDPATALAEMRRLLTPDGLLIFHTVNAKHFLTGLSCLLPQKLKNAIVGFLEGRQETDIFPTYYRINTVKSISALAQHGGFKVVELKFVNSTAETFMLGPIVIFELLITRLLNLNIFRNYRSNIVAVLRRHDATNGQPT